MEIMYLILKKKQYQSNNRYIQRKKHAKSVTGYKVDPNFHEYRTAIEVHEFIHYDYSLILMNTILTFFNQ